MPFEQLDVWKRSARLSGDIYKQLSNLRDYGFRDQITRAGLSIPSNIAEGVERDSARDVVRFLYIAKASVGELRTQVYIGVDIGYIPPNVGSRWIEESRQLSAMLVGLIERVRRDSANSN